MGLSPYLGNYDRDSRGHGGVVQEEEVGVGFMPQEVNIGAADAVLSIAKERYRRGLDSKGG